MVDVYSRRQVKATGLALEFSETSSVSRGSAEDQSFNAARIPSFSKLLRAHGKKG